MNKSLRKVVMLKKTKSYEFYFTLKERYGRVKRYSFIKILSQKVSCCHVCMRRNLFPQIILLLQLRYICLSIYVNTFKNLKISINNVSTNCKLSFWITLIELIFARIESTNFTSFDRFCETCKNYLKTV